MIRLVMWESDGFGTVLPSTQVNWNDGSKGSGTFEVIDTLMNCYIKNHTEQSGAIYALADGCTRFEGVGTRCVYP